MLVIMRSGYSERELKKVFSKIEEAGLKAEHMPGEDQTVVAVIGKNFDKSALELEIAPLEGVENIVFVSSPYLMASKEFGGKRKITVERGDVSITFNGNEVVMMAGPCAVESYEQMDKIAKKLSSLGVKVLRGGSFKPRTSPRSFQGLGKEGLKIHREIADKYKMLVITELLDVRDADLVAQYADIIQIGTRNMQNFSLLQEAGRLNKPVMLKRGMSATIKDWVYASEYILKEQKDYAVILCARGIRTFEQDTRNTPDLMAMEIVKNSSWLPVIYDPSHSVGKRQYVLSTSLMAITGGASGLIIETHPDPPNAFVDGEQSLNFEEFESLYLEVKKLCEFFKKKLI